jgi:hypothetical protein
MVLDRRIEQPSHSPPSQRCWRRVGASPVALIVAVLIGLVLVAPDRLTAQTATPTVPAAPTLSLTPLTLTVTGQLTLGTPGLSLPEALPLTLNVLTSDAAGRVDVKTHNAVAAPDRTFRFDAITTRPGASLFVTTRYAGVTQGSPVAQVQNAQATLDLPVTLYAATTEAATVTLVRAQYILDFKAGNSLQVLATFYYSNTSDRLFITEALTAQSKPISVSIPLPIGAQAIAFTNTAGTRYAIGGTDFAPIIHDTSPVIPGQPHEIIVSYNVPYNKGAPIDQDYPFATQMLEVLIPDDALVKLTGDFDANPNISINPQRPYTQYNLKQPIAAGGRLIYTLEGVPPNQATRPGATARPADRSADFLPFLVLVGVVVVASVFVITYLFRPKRAAR